MTDRFQYGYDRDGNRVYRANAVTHANPQLPFDELYHAGGAADTYDAQGNLLTAGYDRLNQLTAFRRGTLNAANTDLTVGSLAHSQDWTLDVLGNWASVLTDGSTQSRTHNQLNEVTQVGGASLGFDGAGNTTADGTGKQFVYDAWDRLVRVNFAAAPVAYAYDALGRRVQENENNTFGDAVTRDLYFSAQWQVLEERETAAAYANLVRAQQVWGPVYVDALVERDRDPARNGSGALSERLYAQQDANWDVTALVGYNGAAWQVAERYVYDPYGAATVYDPGWAAVRGASQYGWAYLHQGGRLDTTSSLYNFRLRDYSPTLGRWMQNDPIGYSSGDLNLYRYERDNPAVWTDPLGLDPYPYPRVPPRVPPRLPIPTRLPPPTSPILWPLYIAALEIMVATNTFGSADAIAEWWVGISAEELARPITRPIDVGAPPPPPPPKRDCGDCSPEEHAYLQARVVTACRFPNFRWSCKGNQDLPTLEYHLSLAHQCLDARLTLQERCFKYKPDPNHETEAIPQVLDAIENCLKLILKKKFPPLRSPRRIP